jgi:hypothetical protein
MKSLAQPLLGFFEALRRQKVRAQRARVRENRVAGFPNP